MMTRRPVAQHRRRGALALLVACCLIALLSVVAIALDGGLLFEDRRRAQAAADAAALAAANELFRSYVKEQGSDESGTAAASALAVAAANGFDDDSADCDVTVHIPPTSGPFTGQDGYAEVLIQYSQTRYFSRLFGSDTIPISARAVARGAWTVVGNGIICLDRSAEAALHNHGNGMITVNDAPIIINSTNAVAGLGEGANAKLEAPEINFGGGYSTLEGAQFIGTINTGVRPIPDPLRFLPVPNPNTLPKGTMTSELLTTVSGVTKTYYLTPGVYPRGLSFSGQESVVMAPGIYYMEDGGFSFSGQGSLLGEGVMIYNAATDNGDQISITGQGVVKLTPPTSGPYKGLTIFQDRNANVTVKVAGNGLFDIEGGFYAANAPVLVEGNGDKSIGSQYICRTLDVGGNGAFTVTWNPDQTSRTRILQLVE
jgi:hypothetical protein